MADYSELKRKAQEIKDEVKAGANTANRVGLALEETVKALEATNKEVAKKQNKLDNYKEDPSNGSVEIFSQDIVSMRNYSQGGVASVEVYNEENTGGIIPVAKMSAEKENGDYAYVEARGNEVNIVGDYVNVNGDDLSQIIQDVVALNMRVHELGNFATAKNAEDKAREPLYSGNEGISIIHYTVNGSTDGLILQHQDVDGGYHRSVQTLLYHGRMYVRFVWFTDSTRTVLLENANFNRDWWETSISHLEYDKTTHTIKCRRIGQDVNSTKWITLPSASTSTDGLMTMAQVKSLEGKQDALQTYEETTDKAEVKMPNGNSYVRVTKDSAGMYAQDDKSGIVNSSIGSRLVYKETATDASGSSYTSHRDDISIGKHSENSATHITLTSKSTTEEAGEKITNTSTIQVNPYGISMSSPNGEIGDIVKEISEKASSESVGELRQEVEDKAPKSGYAPDLKVNFAEELVGRGEATPEVIGGIRPTGEISIGDGNATIERIKGNSVVWNQLVNHSHWKSTTNNGVTFTVEDDGKIVVNGTATGLARIMINPYFGLKANHKYVLTGAPNNANGTTLRYFGTALRDEGDGCVINVTTDAYNALAIEVTEGLTVNNAIFYPKLTDLTQMFGEGNEPTTIEEFEARKPLNVTNEYNEGTLVSYQGDEIKSVGFNAWDEEWEYGDISANGENISSTVIMRSKNYIPLIPNQTYRAEYPNYSNVYMGLKLYDNNKNLIYQSTLGGGNRQTFNSGNNYAYARFTFTKSSYSTICIHLAHSGYRNGDYEPYVEDIHPLPNVKNIKDSNGDILFPYGLLSAGSVHDEITATKAIKRVGVVDTGTLSWKYGKNSNWAHELHYAEVATAMPKSDFQSILVRYTKGESVNKITDKQYVSGAANRYIYIYDSSYTSASDFKQAMSGVLLYYELATPIEVDLPEPLNMTYEAWDFGTEELVAKGATTPLNADIVYQFNAVDRIRENSSAIDDLEEHAEEHKDDGIELLSNGNLKLTLKGETREFMPATPSGDPMHYAYVSAGAEYNDSGKDIVKDAPWAALADTDEEKKVTHKAGCWYLNGVGDMTNDDIRYSYINRTLLYDLNRRASFSSDTALRTIYPVHRGSSVSGLGPTKASTLFQCTKLETCLLSNMQGIRQERDYSLSLSSSYEFFKCTALKAIGQVTPTTTDINRFAHCTSLRYIWMYALQVSINLKDSSLISKLSVKYMIKNAAPTSAITITLHADAYARLAEDADIVAALAAKPLVTLVSA